MNSKINLDPSRNLQGVVKFILPFIFIIGVQSIHLSAQSGKTFVVVDEHKDYEILYHKNGSVLNGTSLFEDEEIILFKLFATSDTISVDKELLLNVDLLEEVAFNHTIQENVGITPTAFNLKKGEQRYRNVYLLYNDYSRGISDKVSFTVGVTIPPEAFFDSEFAVGLATRLKYAQKLSENISVAIAPSIYYDSYNEELISLMPAALTIGKPNKFLNLGSTLMYDHYNEEFYNLITIGGGYSLNDKFSVVTDNLIFIDNGDVLVSPSFMVKYIYKGKHQMQLGLYHVDEFPIPVFSYAYFWN